MPPQSSCAACGDGHLTSHLRTATAGSDFAPSTKEFGRALSDIGRCGTCGHMQLLDMPTDVILGEVYGEAADLEYVDEEVGQRATASAVLDRLERRVQPGRLLDLGCWVGFLLSEASARGWQTTGVEPSAWASGYASEKLGLDVRHDDLMTAPLPEHAFDAIVLGDVIEHLPDPSAGLQRIEQLLAPGGALVLMLPDAGSRLARLLGRRWWSVLPTHVQYFTRASLTRLLNRHGWRVVEVATAPKVFTVGYYLGRVSGYSPTLGRLLVRLAGPLRDRLWALDLRDRMLVIAVRDG